MATQKQADFLTYQKEVYNEFLFYLLTYKSPRKFAKSAFRLLQVYESMAQELTRISQDDSDESKDFADTLYSNRSKSKNPKSTK